MRNLLRQREIAEDDWVYLSEQPPGGSEAVIISLAEWRDNIETWRAWRERLGVRIGPADRVETLAPDLARFELIAIEFPGPGEGRGYTQARLLRTRYGFKGELRAVGAVKQDQLLFMLRCGFDTFELAEGEDVAAASAALQRFSVGYQPRGALAIAQS
jgi:phosphoadenosine phosphosulfate reductase